MCVCVCLGTAAACSLWQTVSLVSSSPSDRWRHYVRPLADTNYCGRSRATTYKMSDVEWWVKLDALPIWIYVCSSNQLSSTKWIQTVTHSPPLFKSLQVCKESLKGHSKSICSISRKTGVPRQLHTVHLWQIFTAAQGEVSILYDTTDTLARNPGFSD